MRSFRITALCLLVSQGGLLASPNATMGQVSPTPPTQEPAEEKPPERWSEAMQAFRKQDAQTPYPPGGTVFVGSSSIRLWDLKKGFPGASPLPLNRGFGGSQIADSLRHLDLLVLKHKPRTVVMYAGDNDIAGGKSPEQVARDFQTFAERVLAASPKTRIVYVAIKPSLARWNLADKMRQANDLIAAGCGKRERLTFLDIWPAMLGEDGRPRAGLLRNDGLHLNDAGYAVWNKMLAGVLRSGQDERAPAGLLP